MPILVLSCRNEHSGHFLWLRQQTIRAWDTLTMFEATVCGLKLRCAGGREFDPRPGQYSRMSFSSDQVTGTVFSHLNMPFLPNSEFI